MNLLTQASLSPDQWAVLRVAPHLVVVAVSASEGSRLDTVLERAAGKAAIANGINNDHPLVRAIAGTAEVEAAAAAITALVTDARGSLRAPPELLLIATEAARRAADVLRVQGGELDRHAYREFVLGVARKVAEAAREGDILGIGGRLVSDAERAAINAIAQALA
jgi:hypothetical protein